MLRVEQKGDNKILYGRDRTYYINQKEKTVVCKLNNCKLAVIDFLKYNLHVFLPGCKQKPYNLSDSYIGKAVCHPEDEFDEKLGMKIAVRRALEKYNDAKLRKLALFEDVMFSGEIKNNLLKEETRLLGVTFSQVIDYLNNKEV